MSTSVAVMQQLGLEIAEVVGAVGVGEDLRHVPLEAAVVVDAGRQPLGEPHRHVHHRDLADVGWRAGGRPPTTRSGSTAAGWRRPGSSGRSRCFSVGILDRRGQRRVEDPHHLLGGDAVGDHAADEGAGAGADVDVEVVDGAVDRQQVEGAQSADLVDAAGEPAAAEHQRGLLAPSPSPSRPPYAIFGALELDDLPHEQAIMAAGLGGAATLRRHDCSRWTVREAQRCG